MFIIHPNYVAGGIMPARHFIFTSIIIFSSSVFAQEPTSPEVTSEPVAISEVKEVAPQTTVPAVQAEPIAAPVPVAPTPAQAPAPAVDPKVEAMQKQIEEMQKQLQTLSAPKTESPTPPRPLESSKSPQISGEKALTTPPLTFPEFEVLRPRDVSLSWLYRNDSIERDESQGGSTSSSKIKMTKLQIEFTRNFSKFELGAFLSTEYAENDDLNVSTAIGGPLIKINFIENAPGHNFIPYFAGYYCLAGYERNSSTSSKLELSGNGLAFGFGFNWFPFGELFALNAELSQLKGEIDNDANPKLTVEEEQTSLQLGWRIYF
ncbi:FimV family protein [Bdellovibrio bacteriovorus]|uniref:type IV pilus assembly protein FimV n=1 Tax=Bdellovibrio bacteriovorus TaxID=959 RepID=UPI0035A6D0BE